MNFIESFPFIHSIQVNRNWDRKEGKNLETVKETCKVRCENQKRHYC